MKRLIYFSILFLLFGASATKAQAPMYTVNVNGHISGLNGLSTPVSLYFNSQWLPYILATDANGNFSVDMVLDSFMFPGTLEVVFSDCGMNTVSASAPVDTNNLSPVITAEYCASGDPFGSVTVHLPDAGGEAVPVNVYSGTFGGSFWTDASGSVSVAVPYTDPYQDVMIEHYVCQGGMWDTVLTDVDLSAGVTFTGTYCEGTVWLPNVTVNVHLDNTNGINVPVVVITDGFMTPGITDANGDAVVQISVADATAPIYVNFNDCAGQTIDAELFLAPGDTVLSYVSDYCPGGNPDTCGVLFTASYDPNANAFVLEMDSVTQADAIEFIWDFGDGAIDSTQYPSHVYDENGLYNVCLYVAFASGQFCSYCHEIGIDTNGNVITRTETNGFTVQVVPFGTTAVQEQLPEQSFELYPNPADDFTTMQLYSDTAVSYTVNVHNTVGQIVKTYSLDAQQGHNAVKLPVNDLVQGYYIVSVEIGNKTVSRAFVK